MEVGETQLNLTQEAADGKPHDSPDTVTVNGIVYSPAEHGTDQSDGITINGITYVPLTNSEATIDTNDNGGASKSCCTGDFDKSVSPSFKMTVNAHGSAACSVLMPQSKS
jgi:hypothetical protein